MLRLLLMLASFANSAGGVVLVGTWAMMAERVPIIVLWIGSSLLIQGVYTILYLHGELNRWGEFPSGALFAGECLAACVGAGGLIQAVLHNLRSDDLEMVPVLAGILMLSQAILALLYLLLTGRLQPAPSNHRGASGF